MGKQLVIRFVDSVDNKNSKPVIESNITYLDFVPTESINTFLGKNFVFKRDGAYLANIKSSEPIEQITFLIPSKIEVKTETKREGKVLQRTFKHDITELKNQLETRALLDKPILMLKGDSRPQNERSFNLENQLNKVNLLKHLNNGKTNDEIIKVEEQISNTLALSLKAPEEIYTLYEKNELNPEIFNYLKGKEASLKEEEILNELKEFSTEEKTSQKVYEEYKYNEKISKQIQEVENYFNSEKNKQALEKEKNQFILEKIKPIIFNDKIKKLIDIIYRSSQEIYEQEIKKKAAIFSTEELEKLKIEFIAKALTDSFERSKGNNIENNKDVYQIYKMLKAINMLDTIENKGFKGKQEEHIKDFINTKQTILKSLESFVTKESTAEKLYNQCLNYIKHVSCAAVTQQIKKLEVFFEKEEKENLRREKLRENSISDVLKKFVLSDKATDFAGEISKLSKENYQLKIESGISENKRSRDDRKKNFVLKQEIQSNEKTVRITEKIYKQYKMFQKVESFLKQENLLKPEQNKSLLSQLYEKFITSKKDVKENDELKLKIEKLLKNDISEEINVEMLCNQYKIYKEIDSKMQISQKIQEAEELFEKEEEEKLKSEIERWSVTKALTTFITSEKASELVIEQKNLNNGTIQFIQDVEKGIEKKQEIMLEKAFITQIIDQNLANDENEAKQRNKQHRAFQVIKNIELEKSLEQPKELLILKALGQFTENNQEAELIYKKYQFNQEIAQKIEEGERLFEINKNEKLKELLFPKIKQLSNQGTDYLVNKIYEGFLNNNPQYSSYYNEIKTEKNSQETATALNEYKKECVITAMQQIDSIKNQAEEKYKDYQLNQESFKKNREIEKQCKEHLKKEFIANKLSIEKNEYENILNDIPSYHLINGKEEGFEEKLSEEIRINIENKYKEIKEKKILTLIEKRYTLNGDEEQKTAKQFYKQYQEGYKENTDNPLLKTIHSFQELAEEEIQKNIENEIKDEIEKTKEKYIFDEIIKFIMSMIKDCANNDTAAINFYKKYKLNYEKYKEIQQKAKYFDNDENIKMDLLLQDLKVRFKDVNEEELKWHCKQYFLNKDIFQPIQKAENNFELDEKPKLQEKKVIEELSSTHNQDGENVYQQYMSEKVAFQKISQKIKPLEENFEKHKKNKLIQSLTEIQSNNQPVFKKISGINSINTNYIKKAERSIELSNKFAPLVNNEREIKEKLSQLNSTKKDIEQKTRESTISKNEIDKKIIEIDKKIKESTNIKNEIEQKIIETEIKINLNNANEIEALYEQQKKIILFGTEKIEKHEKILENIEKSISEDENKLENIKQREKYTRRIEDSYDLKLMTAEIMNNENTPELKKVYLTIENGQITKCSVLTEDTVILKKNGNDIEVKEIENKNIISNNKNNSSEPENFKFYTLIFKEPIECSEGFDLQKNQFNLSKNAYDELKESLLKRTSVVGLTESTNGKINRLKNSQSLNSILDPQLENQRIALENLEKQKDLEKEQLRLEKELSLLEKKLIQGKERKVTEVTEKDLIKFKEKAIEIEKLKINQKHENVGNISKLSKELTEEIKKTGKENAITELLNQELSRDKIQESLKKEESDSTKLEEMEKEYSLYLSILKVSEHGEKTQKESENIRKCGFTLDGVGDPKKMNRSTLYLSVTEEGGLCYQIKKWPVEIVHGVININNQSEQRTREALNRIKNAVQSGKIKAIAEKDRQCLLGIVKINKHDPKFVPKEDVWFSLFNSMKVKDLDGFRLDVLILLKRGFTSANFFFMSKFDIEQCSEITGNAIILTDDNQVVYLTKGDKEKDYSIHTVKIEKRQGLPICQNDAPINLKDCKQYLNTVKNVESSIKHIIDNSISKAFTTETVTKQELVDVINTVSKKAISELNNLDSEKSDNATSGFFGTIKNIISPKKENKIDTKNVKSESVSPYKTLDERFYSLVLLKVKQDKENQQEKYKEVKDLDNQYGAKIIRLKQEIQVLKNSSQKFEIDENIKNLEEGISLLEDELERNKNEINTLKKPHTDNKDKINQLEKNNDIVLQNLELKRNKLELLCEKNIVNELDVLKKQLQDVKNNIELMQKKEKNDFSELMESKKKLEEEKNNEIDFLQKTKNTFNLQKEKLSLIGDLKKAKETLKINNDLLNGNNGILKKIEIEKINFEEHQNNKEKQFKEKIPLHHYYASKNVTEKANWHLLLEFIDKITGKLNVIDDIFAKLSVFESSRSEAQNNNLVLFKADIDKFLSNPHTLVEYFKHLEKIYNQIIVKFFKEENKINTNKFFNKYNDENFNAREARKVLDSVRRELGDFLDKFGFVIQKDVLVTEVLEQIKKGDLKFYPKKEKNEKNRVAVMKKIENQTVTENIDLIDKESFSDEEFNVVLKLQNRNLTVLINIINDWFLQNKQECEHFIDYLFKKYLNDAIDWQAVNNIEGNVMDVLKLNERDLQLAIEAHKLEKKDDLIPQIFIDFTLDRINKNDGNIQIYNDYSVRYKNEKKTFDFIDEEQKNALLKLKLHLNQRENDFRKIFDEIQNRNILFDVKPLKLYVQKWDKTTKGELEEDSPNLKIIIKDKLPQLIHYVDGTSESFYYYGYVTGNIVPQLISIETNFFTARALFLMKTFDEALCKDHIKNFPNSVILTNDNKVYFIRDGKLVKVPSFVQITNEERGGSIENTKSGVPIKNKDDGRNIEFIEKTALKANLLYMDFEGSLLDISYGNRPEIYELISSTTKNNFSGNVLCQKVKILAATDFEITGEKSENFIDVIKLQSGIRNSRLTIDKITPAQKEKLLKLNYFSNKANFNKQKLNNGDDVYFYQEQKQVNLPPKPSDNIENDIVNDIKKLQQEWKKINGHVAADKISKDLKHINKLVSELNFKDGVRACTLNQFCSKLYVIFEKCKDWFQKDSQKGNAEISPNFHKVAFLETSIYEFFSNYYNSESAPYVNNIVCDNYIIKEISPEDAPVRLDILALRKKLTCDWDVAESKITRFGKQQEDTLIVLGKINKLKLSLTENNYIDSRQPGKNFNIELLSELKSIYLLAYDCIIDREKEGRVSKTLPQLGQLTREIYKFFQEQSNKLPPESVIKKEVENAIIEMNNAKMLYDIQTFGQQWAKEYSGLKIIQYKYKIGFFKDDKNQKKEMDDLDKLIKRFVETIDLVVGTVAGKTNLLKALETTDQDALSKLLRINDGKDENEKYKYIDISSLLQKLNDWVTKNPNDKRVGFINDFLHHFPDDMKKAPEVDLNEPDDFSESDNLKKSHNIIN